MCVNASADRPAAPDCDPPSCRSRSRDRAAMRSGAMPADSQAWARPSRKSRPRSRHRDTRRFCCMVRGVALHVHQAHRRARAGRRFQSALASQRHHVVDEMPAPARAASRMTSAFIVSTDSTASSDVAQRSRAPAERDRVPAAAARAPRRDGWIHRRRRGWTHRPRSSPRHARVPRREIEVAAAVGEGVGW